jgi:hypothetical protein
MCGKSGQNGIARSREFSATQAPGIDNLKQLAVSLDTAGKQLVNIHAILEALQKSNKLTALTKSRKTAHS